MKKIVYSGEVLGIVSVWYDLHRENKDLYDEFMKKVFELGGGYLEDVTELFDNVKDFDFLQSANGFVVIDGKTYSFYSPKDYEMRADEGFHKILEEYNQKLSRPSKLSYKEISDERFPFMTIAKWDDSSESILFTE